VVGGPDLTWRNYVIGAPISAVEVDAGSANAIHDNSGLGINLRPVGEPASTVTPNHPGGGASGPNELLNFPIITNVTYVPYNTMIAGAITNGQPNQNFYVDLYYNPTNDPSGNGQGRYFAAADNNRHL